MTTSRYRESRLKILQEVLKASSALSDKPNTTLKGPTRFKTLSRHNIYHLTAHRAFRIKMMLLKKKTSIPGMLIMVY